ncbi:MAG: hypothetical protein JOY99_02705 [Sphingomonadaceae bacterium]|nr:hypothetical protein [Sphingomonadaceae bacterium]
MTFLRLAGAALAAFALAAPASAQSVPGAPVAADLALLGAGVIGVLLGRRGSKSDDSRPD